MNFFGQRMVEPDSDEKVNDIIASGMCAAMLLQNIGSQQRLFTVPIDTDPKPQVWV